MNETQTGEGGGGGKSKALFRGNKIKFKMVSSVGSVEI